MDLSSTISNILKEWNSWGISIERVIAPATFYSGQVFYSSSLESKDLLDRKALWISQSAYWAAEYCYWTGDKEPSSRCLFKLKLEKDILLVRFPAELHPADVFKVEPRDKKCFELRKDMSSLKMQPDHFISMYWNKIISGTKFEECIGHLRRASLPDVESLGAEPETIIEACISDPSVLTIEQMKLMPSKKDEYIDAFCAEKKNVAAGLFGID